MDAAGYKWQPQTFFRHEQAYNTSMGTARIMTDVGPAYIKAMGNPQGPHCLAAEWVATQLAAWLGLPTFEFALMCIDEEVDEIPFFRGGTAASGPAFVTRAVVGHPWSGAEDDLRQIQNLDDVSRLVVFDTWTRNCDRHPPDLSVRRPNFDNVFLERLPDGMRMIAMDHSHCFTCGRDLTEKVSQISILKDDRIYGLFDGFRSLVRQDVVEAACQRLRDVSEEVVTPIVESIPEEWEVSKGARNALTELIVRRSDFVSANIPESIGKACWSSQLFDRGV